MSLREYLAARRAEIEAQMKALKVELAEIRAAEQAIGATIPADKGVRSATPRGPRAIREGSIKDWILRALTQISEGLETDDVIRVVEAIGGPEVPRNSMTPQLSRLKAGNLITQEGRRWRLVGQPPTNETPGVAPPSASTEADDGLWTIHPTPARTEA